MGAEYRTARWYLRQRGDKKMATQKQLSLGLLAFLLLENALWLIPLKNEVVFAASVEDVALLKSSNREKVLVEGAKKEGKVSFYTGLIVDQVVRPVKDAFEKEYPFLQVEFFRGNSERIAQKVLAEYQAKRYEVDVISGSAAATMVQRAGYMQRFYSPHLTEYPPELKDAKGFWGSTNVYFMTLGYNTRSVKASELPKTYEDLLNPRWKGQTMWSTSRGSGAPQFIGNIFITMGQEAGKVYIQKLKQQNIAKSTASARQILDLVIAGEYPMAIQIFNHHAYISKMAGAPVEWQPLEPVTATNNSIGLAKNAPHPHASMLFLDFVLSKKGQRVFQQSNYLPAHPEIPALQADLKPGGGRFKKANYLSPEILYDKGNDWVDYFQKEFMK
ncbi:MAG: extracellular solute-binding protein [Deltaproteobacteria bacterium]|nr:MAG: extracellular solute-binding protein [Deltaproteobacteria bacterium]